MKKLLLVALGGVFALPVAASASSIPDGYAATDTTRSCISSRDIQKIKAAGDGVLLVKVRGGKTYLSETRGNCKRAGKQGYYLQYRNTSANVCKGQSVKVKDNNINATVSSCSLGKFTLLEKKAAE